MVLLNLTQQNHAFTNQKKCTTQNKHNLQCGPMPNAMAALPNIGGANKERKFRNAVPCHTPQTLADAHCSTALQ